MPGMTRVWIVNQTGTRLSPFGASKYSQLARHLVNDPNIKIVNPKELERPPEQLPYVKRDTRPNPTFEIRSHRTDPTPFEISDQYFDRHMQYFRAVCEQARQNTAIPVVFADPHEFSLAPGKVLAEFYTDLQIPVADMHMDFLSGSFLANGFFRYGITRAGLDPRSIQLFGSSASPYRDRQNRRHFVVITDQLVSQLPDWVMERICCDRQDDLPSENFRQSMLAMVLTANRCLPDLWTIPRIRLELSLPERIAPFFDQVVILQARIYLYKIGVWVDLEQPIRTFDYKGRPIFFSLDTDVSSSSYRDQEEIVRDLMASVKTGQLVGLHVAEAETPLNRWSAERIYQIIRDVLVN